MPTFRPLPWLSAICAIALVILIGLGNWQVKRLVWKSELIEAVETRVNMTARPLSQLLADTQSLDDIHFARVFVSGAFRHDLTVYMFTTQGELGVGYFVIAPLELSDGSFVMVNRGFVPKAAVDNVANSYEMPEGRLTVEGLVRLPDTPRLFTPNADVAERIWFSRDLDQMASTMGLETIVPVFVDAAVGPDEATWPRGGLTRVTFANNHLGYALTWYGLAFALIAVYIAYHIRMGRVTWPERRPK